MKINAQLTDEAVLREVGERLAAARVALNLTQAHVAEEAGISKRTLERLETGAVSSQFSSILRVCRVLGLLDRLDLFLPEQKPGPMEQLKRQGKPRQRASGKREEAGEAKPWTWGENR